LGDDLPARPISPWDDGAASAAIGGALGAGGGFLVGNELQNQEASQHQTQAQINAQQREIEQFKQQQETE
jgi:hypothetical protein